MTKILLVDDERNVLSSLRRTIHAMPADTFEGPVSIETFEKPEQALLRAAECEFDLVISDWRMPGMNGIAFLNELIQIQPTIARLVLSGYGDFLSELKAIQRIKVFHFINKPWDNNELASLLRLALEHRRLMLANVGLSDKELKRETRLTQLELQRIDQEEPGILKMKRESLDPFQLCG